MLLCYFTWQDSRWGHPAFSDRQTSARTEGHDHWRWSARHRVSIIHGHENLWLEKDRKPDGQKETKRRIGNLQCRCKSLNTSQVAQTAGAYLQHEATRSIATPPGWDASPSQVTPQHFIRFPWQFTSTHLYSWVEKGTVIVKCLAQEHNTMTRPGL